MFIQAHGRGYCIPAVLFACFMLTDWFTGRHFHDQHYYAQHGWPKLAAFTLAAVILWFLSADRQDELIPGTAPAEQKTPFLRAHDSFFWVPARYWPALSLALGLLFYLVRI
jgi:hypothetical protein